NQVGGTHWSLLIFSRVDKVFFHFDSLSGGNSSHAQMLYKKLEPHLSSNKDNKRFVEMDALQQENGYDCGVHLICNAENVIEHFKRTSTVFNVSRIEVSAVKR